MKELLHSLSLLIQFHGMLAHDLRSSIRIQRSVDFKNDRMVEKILLNVRHRALNIRQKVLV